MKTQRFRIPVWACGMGMVLLSTLLWAQPALPILKSSVAWPEVTLTIAPTCNSLRSYDWTPAQLELTENGTLMTNVQVTCPDTSTSQLRSLALVLDASGSMAGSGNAGAIQMGHHLVDNKMGIMDEATIFHFASTVTKVQGLTSNHTLLNAAISTLASSGATACWDGIYAGLEELVSSSSNPSRCLIVLTDGDDNSSTHTPQQIIALAQANSIKVFTIGLGNFSGSIGDLINISQNTGGVFRNAPTTGHLIPVIDEIWNMLDYEPCTVRYTSSCEDGKSRAVTLRLNNFCGGSPLATFTFQAPFTPSSFVPIHFALDTLDTPQQAEVRMTLRLNTPELGLLAPCNGQIVLDRRYLDFLRYEPDPNPAIMGFNPAIQKGFDQLTFSSSGNLPILRDGTLGTFVFRSIAIPDTVTTPVRLSFLTFQYGCREPKVYNGQVRIFGGFAPRVFASGKVEFCEGDSVVLTAEDGFASYQWSTGSTDRRVVIRSGGIYTVFVTRFDGKSGTSDPIEVTVHPNPRPVVTPSGPVVLCPNQTASLEVTAAEKYRWNSADTTRQIWVMGGGTYVVEVEDIHGCRGVSDSVRVLASTVTAQITPPSPVILCPGDTAHLTADSGPYRYRWSTGDSTQTISKSSPGQVTVVVTDAFGCSVTSSPVDIRILTVVKPSITLSPPSSSLCEGDTVVLDAGPGYATYRWNRGDTTRSIAVTHSGSYSVHVTAAAGCSASSTPSVITVHSLPYPVITPGGPIQLCVGDTVRLDAGAGYAMYQWNMGGIGRRLAVTDAGMYSVLVTDSNGCSASSPPVIVTTLPQPITPVIVSSGGELRTDSAVSYQWFLNRIAIAGATGRTWRPVASGSYTVDVTNADGCRASSQPLDVVVDVKALPETPRLVIWPDPARDEVFCALRASGPGPVQIEVRDLLGRRVRFVELTVVDSGGRVRIPVADLPTGVYLLRVVSDPRSAPTLFRKQ